MTYEQVGMLVITCILLTVCVYFIWSSNKNTPTISGLIKNCNKDIKKHTKTYNKKLKDKFHSKVGSAIKDLDDDNV